jgi:hypothetical protein
VDNAEFHAVLRTTRGDLIDVTPKVDHEQFILFLPDPTFAANFDCYRRPNNVRMRAYGHAERRDAVAEKILGFNEVRLGHEWDKARAKGLTLVQSIGMGLKRDPFEKLIDKFIEEVGAVEAMLVPTSEGMACKNPARVSDFHRRARDVERLKAKLFLMVDMAVRGMAS